LKLTDYEKDQAKTKITTADRASENHWHDQSIAGVADELEPFILSAIERATDSIHAQPQRSEQEWTLDWLLEKYCDTNGFPNLKGIADAHRAELATEREKNKQADIELDRIDRERSQVRQQLLCALAAIEKHNNTLRVGSCHYIEVDLSALREHDAKVLQPLVELLEQVLFETVDALTYPDGPCLVKSTRDEIKDALAKVKEGK